MEEVSGAIGIEAVLMAIWRLLVTCIAALTVSSLAELAWRAAEMSGQPLLAILPVLPTVLFRTHYGEVWLMRPAALTALWLGWWMGRQRPRSQLIPALMLGAGALVAMTRSASGHAADWGDLTFPEVIDWLHLMASSLWGGGLLALCITVFPAVLKLSARRRLIADLVHRFSTLASVALFVVLLTGLYNGWLQVGTIGGMWAAPYGRTLLVKLLLVIPLLVLGATNHFISVPLLQRWSERAVLRRPGRISFLVIRRFTIGLYRPQAVRLVRRFLRRIWAEALFIVGILICTAFLLHGTPARHRSHMGHDTGGRELSLNRPSTLPEAVAPGHPWTPATQPGSESLGPYPATHSDQSHPSLWANAQCDES
jgi:putative copper export protein